MESPGSLPEVTPARRWSRIAELAVAGAILSWRLWELPLLELWRDWVTLAALYWAFTAIAPRSRAWPAVSVAGMAFLLGTYVAGQVPFLLRVLGGLR
jgi:hypothetical protein